MPRRSTDEPGPARGWVVAIALVGTAVISLIVAVGVVAVYRTLQAMSALPLTTTASPTPATPTTPAATPSSRPTPSAVPSASPSATPGGTASPSAEPTPTGPDRSLTANALYAVDLNGQATSCALTVRSPRPPLRNAAVAPYLRTIVDCLVKVFRKPLAAQGSTLAVPRVKTYPKSVSTPCGKFNQSGAPAYYCAADQTIYWPLSNDDANEAFTFARLGYVGLVAHEFGHHLQATTGMIAGYGQRYYATTSKKARYALSRRLELQAQCFEGIFLSTAERSIGFTGNDRYQLHVWHGYTGDEDPPPTRKPDHGTSAAQIRWLDRGLDSQDFGRCNTWTAKASAIR